MDGHGDNRLQIVIKFVKGDDFFRAKRGLPYLMKSLVGKIIFRSCKT
jgi:hypothetical protein